MSSRLLSLETASVGKLSRSPPNESPAPPPPPKGPHPCDWVSAEYGEETAIPGACNSGCVTELPDFIEGKTVIVIGSADGIYCLSSNEKRHITSRMLMKLPSSAHILQAAKAISLPPSPGTPRQCLFVLAYAAPHSEVAVHLVDIAAAFAVRGSATEINNVARFSIADAVPLRIFTYDHVDATSGVQLTSSTGGAFVVSSLPTQDRGACLNVFSINQNGEECKVEADAEAIIDPLWKNLTAEVPASIMSLVRTSNCIAAGTVDGTVVVTSTSETCKRLFAGPVGDLRLFQPYASPQQDARATRLENYLDVDHSGDPSKNGDTAQQGVRLAILDTSGCVFVVSAPAVEDLPRLLCTEACLRIRDRLTTVNIALDAIKPPEEVPTDEITALTEGQDTQPSVQGDAPGTSPPTSQQPAASSRFPLFRGLLSRKSDRKDRSATVGGASPPISAHSNPTFVGKPGGLSTSSINTNSPAAEKKAFLTSASETEELVGTVISRGPIAMGIGDFDLDGRMEVVIGTMGRLLAWCRDMSPGHTSSPPLSSTGLKLLGETSVGGSSWSRDGASPQVLGSTNTYTENARRRSESHHGMLFAGHDAANHRSRFAVTRVTKMPSQLYYIGLVDIYGDGEIVAILVGPQHTIVCRRPTQDPGVGILSERLGILEDLLLRSEPGVTEAVDT